MTHPSDEDRIAHTARLAAKGIMTLEGAADRLFADFEALSREVTKHHYSTDLGLDVEQLKLLDSSDLLNETRAADADDRALHRFFEGLLLGSRPIAPVDSRPPGPGEAIARLAALRQELVAGSPRAREAAGRYIEAEDRLMDATGALALMEAGLEINAPDFGLEKSTTDHARAAAAEAREATRRLAPVLEQVERFQAERLSVATWLAHVHPGVEGTVRPGGQPDGQALTRTLAAMAAAWPVVVDAHRHFRTWKLLLGNRQPAEDAAGLAHQERLATAALRKSLEKLAAQLANEPYPFAHARDGCTIAMYLRGDGPAPDAGSDEDLYAAAGCHLDRALALYYSALGRLAAIALAVEDAVLGQAAAS